MRKSLYDANLRVERAGKHLEELKTLIASLGGDDDANDASVQYDAHAGEPIFTFDPPVPPLASILCGETVYNLRAALDYLVYALAILDTGKIQHGTQFPIDDAPDRFAQSIERGRLKGLNCAHVANIKSLQPYNSCKWTKVLRDLSNPDKHRELTLVRLDGELIFQLRWEREAATDLENAIRWGLVRGKMKVNSREPYSVKFSDGAPVVETLDELKTQVSDLLIQFETQFK
jgi:hypothetical protein